MNLDLLLENLAAYSVQVLALVAVAWALAALFRLRLPRALLAYWQGILVLCVLLPWIQPRQRPIIPYVSAPAVVQSRVVSAAPVESPEFPLYETVAAILLAGMAIRLAWLGIGFCRLSLYRRRAPRLEPLPPALEYARAATGASAAFYLSRELAGPVSFGLFSPAVLLPARFGELEPAFQRAIACHELLHVRRRDWLLTLVEEAVRTLLWFHPAIWWLLGRIQLVREQAVDRLVIEITAGRDHYVEALLEMANVRGRLACIPPAPLFLRRRHFARRLEFIVKEVAMSRIRLAGSLATMSALLAAAGVLTVWSLPLKGEPEFARAQTQEGSKRVRVGGNVQQKKLLHQVAPVYPPLAKQARIQGVVRLQASIAKDGTVLNLTVVSGHPLLIPAALEAVKQWRYEPTLLNNEPVEVITQIDVNFSLSGEGSAAPLLGSESVPFSLDETEEPKRIRVSARVQERKLLYNPEPVYPPLAEQARIRGFVKLVVLISTDGAVKEVRVVSGHPLLVPAAVDAVRQWRYRPTLLDGEPAEVISEIQVNVGARQPEIVERKVGEAVFRVGGDVKPPTLLHKVEPEYTEQARDSKLEGTVVLSCEIGPDGAARNIRVEKWLGLGLDEKAVEAVEQWRFRPGEKGGQPVAVRATVEVNFRLL